MQNDTEFNEKFEELKNYLIEDSHMDYIPTYGVDDNRAVFSGSRISRGLYRCADGLVINADCNGAANIMWKALPDAWNGVSGFSFLASPEVYGFHELNSLSNPVKGIAAA